MEEEKYIPKREKYDYWKKVANLLLIAVGERRHYMAIKSLSRLLGSSNTKYNFKQNFCLNCLLGFPTEISRDKPFEYCRNSETVRMEIPKEGSLVKFQIGQNQLKVQFTMYADFEAILEQLFKQLTIIQKDHTLKLLISTFYQVSV